jgi:hypothetical protein
MSISGDLIDMVDKDNRFLNNEITGDERWCFLYDPQTKQQTSEGKSLSPRRRESFRVDRSKGNFMFKVFFDSQDSPKKIVNKEMYVSILRHLRDAVRKKSPEKWRTNSWFLLHGNAPAHRSVLVKD